jgi:hypothetical protein
MSTQTPRSLSELLALLPDNTSGLISAQDVRDLLVSLYPSRGQIELSGTPVATTFATQNTYTPVLGTTAIDADVCSTCVEMPSNGQIRFVKPITQVALLNATLGVLPAGNNLQYSFTFAINGVPNDLLHVSQGFGILQGRPAGVFVSGLVRLQPNDVVSVVVRADGHTTALTASILTLSGLGVLT